MVSQLRPLQADLILWLPQAAAKRVLQFELEGMRLSFRTDRFGPAPQRSFLQ